MRKTLAVFALLWALCAGAANITNYPLRTTFDANYWFLLSDVAARTNWNLPGNYVASTTDLNNASNALVTQITVSTNGITNAFILNLNNVATGTSNSFLGDVHVGDDLYVTGTSAISELVETHTDTLTATNGITNLNLTASTIIRSDANQALASVANGSGVLTNDGSGTFGWGTAIQQLCTTPTQPPSRPISPSPSAVLPPTRISYLHFH